MSDPEHMQEVMQQFASGVKLVDILESHKPRLDELKQRRNHSRDSSQPYQIIDRLAIVI